MDVHHGRVSLASNSALSRGPQFNIVGTRSASMSCAVRARHSAKTVLDFDDARCFHNIAMSGEYPVHEKML